MTTNHDARIERLVAEYSEDELHEALMAHFDRRKTQVEGTLGVELVDLLTNNVKAWYPEDVFFEVNEVDYLDGDYGQELRVIVTIDNEHASDLRGKAQEALGRLMGFYGERVYLIVAPRLVSVYDLCDSETDRSWRVW